MAGYDLRLAGSTYDKGIGLHSESRLTYALNRNYQWFESLVGLDDQTGRRGSVLIEVLVDGKPQALNIPAKRVEEVRAKIEMRRRFEAAAATICSVNLKRFLQEKLQEKEKEKEDRQI